LVVTVEMIAQNRVPGLEKTVAALGSLGLPVLVGVLSDGDWETPAGWGEVRFNKEADLSWVRNELQSRSSTEWHLRIEPGEFFVGGEGLVANPSGDGYSFCILRGDLMVKEGRLWRGRRPFKNPAYETQAPGLPLAPVYLYSPGHPSVDVTSRLTGWVQRHPSDPDPAYYKAFHSLASRDYDSFRRHAQEYLFLEKSVGEPAVMMRYFLASVQAAVFRDYREALAGLAWCIYHRPFMAEFWCLTADVHMALDHYREASQFFRDAIQAAATRPKDDLWPMLISRNSTYPSEMIERCERALSCSVAVGRWRPDGPR
jgi:hypothetical protein